MVESPQAPARDSIYVWDLPLRIFHWSLAACILTAWLSANIFETLHRVAGYSTIALVAFRVVWGFAGSRYSRLGRLMPLLRAAPRYLWKLRRGRTGGYIGLNPAGAAMLVASLTLILMSAFSGWMQITLRFFGVDWVQDLHTWSSYAGARRHSYSRRRSGEFSATPEPAGVDDQRTQASPAAEIQRR